MQITDLLTLDRVRLGVRAHSRKRLLEMASEILAGSDVDARAIYSSRCARERIGSTGHSAGGNAAIRGANYFGREAQRSGNPSKLHSVFVSGYVLTLRDDVLQDVRSNIGVSYAFYDEGAYRNELKNADMRIAPEALRVVNLGRGEGLYGAPHHDSTALRERLGEVPLGGFFCSGEIGPVHARTYLHGYTSSVGLFRARAWD